MITETGLRFNVLQRAITKRFKEMCDDTLFSVELNSDELWETYLKAFPAGTNPIYRKRTEHDCSCCRHFVKTIGHVVSIADGEMVSLWDRLDIEEGHPYQIVGERLSQYVKAHKIENVFLHKEPTIGQTVSRQQTEEGVLTFEHFFVGLPGHCIVGSKDEVLGEYKTTYAVLCRGLTEIAVDALETVLDLIKQNSLYRGEEHRRNVEVFLTVKREFDRLTEEKQALLCWLNVKEMSPAVSRLRNTVIGSLLCDLSDGVDLEMAVKSFEQKVAPTNYKRPTALVTKAMIEKARTEIDTLGLTSALERRYACAHDITVNNVLFVDRDTKGHLKGDVLSSLQPTKPVDLKAFARVEEIPIEKFVKDVLPGARSLELLVENRHASHFVSLIAPAHADAKRLFKWGNGFSWSYAGDLADSIRERVKQAGGNVTGDLRCSLSWSNYDDLDLHMEELGGYEIHYGNRYQPSPSGGLLDVDMNAVRGTTRTPVENIVYGNRRTMREGLYVLKVHQYTKRESVDVGFSVEIEFDGETKTIHYSSALADGVTVEVARIRYSHESGLSIVKSLPSESVAKTVWGVTTQDFRKVSMVMLSPNYWDGEQVGNKHYFFMLDGCRHDGQVRGFFNEFLKPDLDRHRKVMELVGSKVRTEESAHQLSGLGFSSTQHNSFICRVSGSFNRQVRITI